MTPEETQASLCRLNHQRFAPSLPEQWDPASLDERLGWQRIEFDFIEAERRSVRASALRAPRDPDAFVAWFEGLRATGPGQNDPLFPWLAEEASLEEMTWFLKQEVGGEAGFDDLVALTLLQFPARAKLELARNFWDEMGRGRPGGMHGPMLSHLAEQMSLPDVPIVKESVALGNLMSALACNRHYAYQSIGALGVIELTAPWRAAHVNAGLKRLGIPADVRRYFAIHSTLDVEHSKAWNQEVLHPLVGERPEVAPAIAEGALMRLNAGKRCFERYRSSLWGADAQPRMRCA